MSSESEKCIYRATMVSLFCNIVLVVIKSTILILVNSLAIAVDLGISFVGLAVSVILYYSMKMASRPADLMHNYGYGKVEHVCEGLEGVVLIGIAFTMSSQAILHLFHPKSVGMPWLGLGASAVNAAINFGGAQYIFRMARKSESPAICAEGIHYRMEGVISAMIAFSFLAEILMRKGGLTSPARYVDPLAALFVSLFLVVPSLQLAKGSFFKLLDASMEDSGLMEIMRLMAGHVAKFCEFKSLRTRTAGRKKFVEFKLVVPEDCSFKRGHEICSLLEEDIKNDIPESEVMIRMEPCKKDCHYHKNGEKCPYL